MLPSPFAITSRKTSPSTGQAVILVSCRMGHYFLIFVRPANPRGKKLFSRLRMGIKCSHYRGQLRLGKTVLYIIYAETKLLLK